MLITRRSVIVGGIAVAGAASTVPVNKLVPTSSQGIGPFYPVIRPADEDADLTRVRGAAGEAAGTPINVVGRVLDSRGNPIGGARMELWQANAVGRYAHPGDVRDDAAIDPNFQGYALVTTDRDGQFKFRTIKPGAYKIPGDMRTPHIHLDVRGRAERLITQLYFPGEALNATDLILKTASPRESVIATAIDRLSGDPGALAYRWDVVLGIG
ncbi:MAG: protocatechuate 3,4-dioxygenase [Sphingomonas bacterium]|nr:protocatechuate 3,4-dioxygenase [Sphingomonas bacterium]